MNTKTESVRKVFILEDHPVYREGLVQVVNHEPDLKVCGTADNVSAALRGVGESEPDIVLVDIGLGGKSGLEFIKEIRATNRAVKLLVVSMHDEALYADRVLRAGGDGYIMKEESPEEIVCAIHDVLQGHIYVSEEVLASGVTRAPKTTPTSKPKPLRPLDQLSDSELEFLELIGKGKSESEIAKQLRMTVQSVGDLCLGLARKLNLKGVNALIRYAVCWVETGKA